MVLEGGPRYLIAGRRDTRERDNVFIAAPDRGPFDGLTDVPFLGSGMTLPSGTLPSGVQPVRKELFIDSLDPDFGLQNNDARAIAEKIEGLAWAPDLPNGRHLLYVVSDNDLVPALPTQIFALAIDDTKLTTPLNFEPQVLPGPLYPGQVKKIGRH